jgi:hypothetical protein
LSERIFYGSFEDASRTVRHTLTEGPAGTFVFGVIPSELFEVRHRVPVQQNRMDGPVDWEKRRTPAVDVKGIK